MWYNSVQHKMACTLAGPHRGILPVPTRPVRANSRILSRRVTRWSWQPTAVSTATCARCGVVYADTRSRPLNPENATDEQAW
jgi:hypothetical protein